MAERNRDGRFEVPIYVGKAIPAGARRGGGLGVTTGPVLYGSYSRLPMEVRLVRPTRGL